MFQRTTCLFKKKRKRRGDFLQDTCPGNLVQLHPARHPPNLSMPGAIFLEDPGFRDLACSHQLSTSWNCSHSESSPALIGNPQRSAVRAAFLVAVSSNDKLLRSFCKVVLSSCLNACRLSELFWRNLYLNDEKKQSETSPQTPCLLSFPTNIRGRPWHRWRRTNPLKSHLEERGEIPPHVFFLTASIN